MRCYNPHTPSQQLILTTTAQMSSTNSELIQDRNTLKKIAETLNRSVDMQSALQTALERLIEIMGLETGWVFLKDETAQEKWQGQGYRLVAYHNLPPALAPDQELAWQGGCQCQALCRKGYLTNKGFMWRGVGKTK